jgi:N2-acetyl-L-2,4-diaminobutanoate deacetylase
LVDLGEDETRGQLIGRLHDFSNYIAAPLEIRAHRAGVMIFMCGGANCQEGTTLFVIAHDAATPAKL